MQLAEKHIITESHENFREIDALCFLSKNLYNAANYIVRQEFIGTSKEVEQGLRKKASWIRYNKLQKTLQEENNPDYIALPRKVSQQVLRQLDRSWKSFFLAIKEWKKNPDKFTGKPSLPRYKHKSNGRNALIYTIQAIHKPELKNSILHPSGTNIHLKIIHSKLREAKITPYGNNYKITITYEKPIEKRDLDPNKIAGIDNGVNNLAAVTSNLKGFTPLLINGRPIKSINQYFNKAKSSLQSELMKLDKNRYTSKKINDLTFKRNCKIENYLHKASIFIVDYLASYGIGTLVIGKNPLWKQEANMGKKNNQNFVNIPHAQFIHMLKYKAELIGMNVIIREEAHTSKCSFLDEEEICHHAKYKGRRIKRGLFKSSDGRLINADSNGSGNIIRKEFPNAFADGIEGVVVRPLRVTIPYSGKPELEQVRHKQVA